jgi:hypothetical protein
MKLYGIENKLKKNTKFECATLCFSEHLVDAVSQLLPEFQEISM